MKIGVVIVTYNRLELLKEVLDAFMNQTLLPSGIIVVDNASTDGTKQFLEEWKDKISDTNKEVIFNETNTGGSGGFYTGLARAADSDFDWIWVSDDDAIPDKMAIEYTHNYLSMNEKLDEISAICSSVINYGIIDVSHRKRMQQGVLKARSCPVNLDEYNNDEFDLNCFSYVGSIISKKKLLQAGLTKKEYFIWYDDTEHSLRLSKIGRIVCVPKIKVYHNVKTDNNSRSVNWKVYYGLRNQGDLLKHHFSKITYLKYCIDIRLRAAVKFIMGDFVTARLYNSAISDSKHNRLGVNNIYKPGWNPNSKR